MVFGRKKKEDTEFQMGIAHAEAARPTPGLTEDYLRSLGRTAYMLMDSEVSGILNDDKNPNFKSLIPAFSHLNRTTNIGNKEAELLMLDYEYINIIHTLNMKEDLYENDGWATLESLKIFARNIIADAYKGWKGKILTEQIKVIRTELEKKKRGII